MGMEHQTLDEFDFEDSLFEEPNVDEPDEGKVTRNEISVFPLIPTIGISIDF